MKSVLLGTGFVSFFALLSFIIPSHDLTGHWKSVSPDKSIVLLDFNKDNTFKVTVDDKTENEGRYKVENEVFYMFDGNCGMQIAGKYKLNFYSEDSVQFIVLQDSCVDRAKEVNGGILTRIK